MGVLIQVFVIVLLVIANGVFAMSEMAIVSARRVRLRQRADKGDAGARAALRLAEEPNRFLSTVQVGITLIGTLAGTLGGVTLAEELAVELARIPGLAPYSESISLTLVVVVITYLSLVLGELVPKRLALGNAEAIAAWVARPMGLLARVAAPVVFLLSRSSDFIVRVIGVRPSDSPPVTVDEVRVMMAQGARAGIFDPEEEGIVDNLFRLGDRRISAIITPRTELTVLDLELSDEANWRRILESEHHYYPVVRGDLNNVEGLVTVRALWVQMIAGQAPDLAAAVQEPLFIPESAPAFKALELLRESQVRAALVLDEMGGIMGIVTASDLLASLVGEGVEIGGPSNPRITQQEDGIWLVDGLLPVDEFEDFFNVDISPEETHEYQTLGGFVMDRLDHIPVVGDSFPWKGLCFSVLRMDKLRVDRVLVTQADCGSGPPDSLNGAKIIAA